MFKDTLKKIEKDLNNLEKIESSKMFEEMVQDKLNNSYNEYNNNLEKNYNYLLSRSTVKVLRNVKKQQQKINKTQENIK